MSFSLKGKNILITAGPTREYIDPVRYISNDSSGEMGFALAETATSIKAHVTLIHGHIAEVPQKGVGRLKGGHVRGIRRISVVSAKEMFTAVKKYYKQSDIIIMAAAVADWRPVRCSRCKIKKSPATTARRARHKGRGSRTIELVPTLDILAWLGRHKHKNQILVGFALETEDLLKNALAKLKAKKCDIIIGNPSKNIGQKKGMAIILTKDGYKKNIGNAPKKVIAKAIFTAIRQKNAKLLTSKLRTA